MSKIHNNPTINEEKININRNAIEHRATWTGLTYVEGKAAGMDLEQVIRSAICKTGQFHGAGYKAQCKDPEDLRSFAEVFLPELGLKTFEMEVVNLTEDDLMIHFHYCPLLTAWQKQGFDEETCDKLCDMAMDGDRNIAKAMGYDFHLGKTLAKGDDICEVHFFKKK